MYGFNLIMKISEVKRVIWLKTFNNGLYEAHNVWHAACRLKQPCLETYHLVPRRTRVEKMIGRQITFTTTHMCHTINWWSLVKLFYMYVVPPAGTHT